MTGEVRVTLTPAGRKIAEDIGGRGPKQAVLTALYEQGNLTVEEIAEFAGLEGDKAVMVVKSLNNSGHVKEAS